MRRRTRLPRRHRVRRAERREEMCLQRMQFAPQAALFLAAQSYLRSGEKLLPSPQPPEQRRHGIDGPRRRRHARGYILRQRGENIRAGRIAQAHGEMRRPRDRDHLQLQPAALRPVAARRHFRLRGRQQERADARRGLQRHEQRMTGRRRCAPQHPRGAVVRSGFRFNLLPQLLNRHIRHPRAAPHPRPCSRGIPRRSPCRSWERRAPRR